MLVLSAPELSKPFVVIGAMCAGVVVSHALARSTFPILLPAIETELLSNRQQSGLLGSANFVAYLVGIVAVTAVSGRVEPIRLLLTGLVLAVAGFVLLFVADRFSLLAAGQGLTGLGGAAIWMSAPTIATSAAAPNRRGLVMGFLSSSMGLGILAASQGTALMRNLADDNELWRPTWVGAGLFTAAVALVIAVIVRAPKTEPTTGGISIDRLRTVPRWLMLSVAYWFSGLVASAFPGFFALLLKDQGYSPGHITNLFSLLGVAAVIGAVNLGRLSDRVGRRPVLVGAMLAIAASAVLALVGAEPFSAIAAAVFGATSFTFPVLIVAYVSDHLRDREFANALGALTMVYGVALIIGPAAAGTVADSPLGLDAVFVGLTAVSLASAAAVSFLPSARPGAVVVTETAGKDGSDRFDRSGPGRAG